MRLFALAASLTVLLTGCGVVSGTMAVVGATASVAGTAASTAISTTGTVVKATAKVGSAVVDKALSPSDDKTKTAPQ